MLNSLRRQEHPLRVAVVGRNLEDLLPLLEAFPCEIVTEAPELVISHGGDGSLLGAERQYPGVPKCPVRDRKQNPKCPEHSEISTLQKLFAGQLKETLLEKLEVVTEDGVSLEGINDVTLDRVKTTSAIRYRIWLDDQLFCSQVVADSLVVSTPFGSTGYYQSITHGNFQVGIGLAYNNSMDLLRYSVIPTESKIKVELLRGPARVMSDNNPAEISLSDGEILNIHITPQRTILLGLDIFRCSACYDLRKQGRHI